MFKYKPDKLKNPDRVITLDENHRNVVKSFKDTRGELETKKHHLSTMSDEIRKYDKMSPKEISPEDMKRKFELKDEVEKLRHEIDDISNYKSELDYYSKIDDILLQYYNILDNTNRDTSKRETTDEVNNSQYKPVRKRTRRQQNTQQNILCFFEDKKPENKDNSNVVESKNNLLPKNKAILRDQYMNAINSNTLTKRNYNTSKYCEKCKLEKILVQNDGIYVCSKCGEADDALIESDIPNYKDSVIEKPSYPYKKINHAVEFLSVKMTKIKN